MIYAIIADVHGNYAALQAVIADAKTKGAEGYLLLGDYIRDTPNLNEVVDTIRELPNCTAILGNGDIGVLSLDETKPVKCVLEQMYPNFWTYHNLSACNLDYLKSLKESADITLSNGKTLHLSHSIALIAHTPRLGAFHSGDYARKMESQPFSFEDGMRDMQNAAELYANEVAEYIGDICLFGHNHLQFVGNVAGKTLCNPGSCGMPSDYDIRAPYAIISDIGDEVKIELHRVSYDIKQTIAAVQNFDEFPHSVFWGKLRIAILKTGSDIAMSRFWQHARIIGGGIFPMPNDVWRKVIATFDFDYNWSVDDWRSFGEHQDTISHYDSLIDENNDPVHDSESAKVYMNKWDGDEFIEAMQLNPNKSALEIGVGTGRLAVRVCGKCASFTGIDISPKTIERAKENLREFDNARLICGDFLTHAFDETFDAIYSSLTFMHIKEKDTTIKKAAALLNPGGRFVLSIDKNRQTEIDYGTRKITVFPDTPEEIISLLSGADLTLETHFETEFAYIFAAEKRFALDTMTDEERQAIIYPIILTGYNPDWPQWYDEESVKIEQAIGTSNIARIRHYGSTSIQWTSSDTDGITYGRFGYAYCAPHRAGQTKGAALT